MSILELLFVDEKEPPLIFMESVFNKELDFLWDLVDLVTDLLDGEVDDEDDTILAFGVDDRSGELGTA